MWKMQGACYICKYKDIMVLEQETITAELLLPKLTHQSLLSFDVWKTALRREI